MTDRTAKASRPATDSNRFGITQAFKRTRVQEETRTTPPLLTVTDTAGATTSNESIETVVDTYNEATVRNNARKLDRLYDKQARFESHKQFLERCLQAAVTPRGLKIELEPSIGNHNEEFLAKWNEKLVKFSRELTQDVIEFCDSTVAETAAKIADTKEDLAKSSNQEQMQEISTTLEKNQQDRIRNLRRNKDRKFNKLKYNINARPARQQYFTSDEEWSDNRNSPPRRQYERSNFNKQENNNNERPQQQRSNWSSQQRKPHNRNSYTNLFKPRTRNNSMTDLHADNKRDDKMKLLERVRLLEAQVQTTPNPGNQTQPSRNNTNNGLPNTQQKNLTSAQSNSPGASLQLDDMLKYITETMETLKTFKTHLTASQSTNPTRSEMC